MDALLQIAIGRSGAGTVVQCVGEIDASNVSEFRQAVNQSVADDILALRIDLTRVTFIDTAVIAVLLVAAHDCKQRGASFEVEASRQVRRTLDLVDVA